MSNLACEQLCPASKVAKVAKAGANSQRWHCFQFEKWHVTGKIHGQMSKAPCMRRFERLNRALHEGFALPTVKKSDSTSVIFREQIGPTDRQVLMVEFEAHANCNEGKLFFNGYTALKGALGENTSGTVSVHLSLSDVSPDKYFHWNCFQQHLWSVSIPDAVEDLCEKCFYECKNLSHVTFGTSSSLKRIGIEAFSKCGLTSIHIPDSVEEFCEKCFAQCESLSRVTFGTSSSLKRIGVGAFYDCGLVAIRIPDTVEELCDKSFAGCYRLTRVTFGKASLLRRIGDLAFRRCDIREISLPDHVKEIADNCFYDCDCLLRISFGALSFVTRLGDFTFVRCALKEIHIPDSVEDIGDRCFLLCTNLCRVAFGRSPSLKRIGSLVFFQSALEEIHIPDSVEEICERCFFFCQSLCRITFGESPALMKIGDDPFGQCGGGMVLIEIPESIEYLFGGLVSSVCFELHVFEGNGSLD